MEGEGRSQHLGSPPLTHTQGALRDYTGHLLLRLMFIYHLLPPFEPCIMCLRRLGHGELERDVLARQLLVHTGEGVQLVLGVVAVLGLQVHLGEGW